MSRFSDLYPTTAFDSHKFVELKEVMDKDLIITNVAFLTGNKGEYAKFTYKETEDGEEFATATYSQVIVDQLKKVHGDENLPITARVEMHKEYFRLV